MEAAIPEVRTPEEAMRAVAGKDPQEITDAERSAATDWFLDPNPDPDVEQAFDFIEVNVGGKVGTSKEKWVRFKVSVMDRDRIKQIRQECTRPNAEGIPTVDELEVNLRTTTEALLDPDLSKPENRVVRGQQFLDPADALQARFAHKSGLIDQIANFIVERSGYNTADIREVRAAGN